MKDRKTVLSVPVDAWSPEIFLKRIAASLKEKKTRTIFAVNAEKIMRARRDPELLRALESSDFLIPDGIGAVIGLKINHGCKVRRTTGVGLMQDLLSLAESRGYRVFLFGAHPGVNRAALRSIRRRHPGLQVSGASHGYVPESEQDRLIEEINASRTDILFVGLGSPKQEKWIHRHKRVLDIRICMGVGGSFDVVAGRVAPAPGWIRKAGLEWFYRLITEPRRIRRQLALPRFLFSLFAARCLSGKRRG